MASRRYSMGLEGGPPEPISFLHASSSQVGLSEGHVPSADGAATSLIVGKEDATDEEMTSSSSPEHNNNNKNSNEAQPSSPKRRKKKQQEPPARERPEEGQPWPYRDTLSFTRTLIFYGAGSITQEHKRACKQIQKCRSLRKKYCGQEGVKIVNPQLLEETDSNKISFQFGTKGVMEVFHASLPGQNLFDLPGIEQFHHDYQQLAEAVSEGAVRSFCFQRLQLLSTAFKMHTTMNTQVETEEQSNCK